jgi:electron transport complex protein RnfE
MLKEFTKGLIKENPVFVLALGLCPALGVTSRVVNALGMGAGVIFVLLGSNIFVSLLKNFIPVKVRIPAYIVIIASFVTIVEMFMEAFIPALFDSLGVFVPLIVVNCVILGRAEAIGMGIGFTFALLVISLVREILGVGTITLIPVGSWDGVISIPGLVSSPARVFSLAAGALLVMGYLIALFRWVEMKVEDGR